MGDGWLEPIYVFLEATFGIAQMALHSFAISQGSAPETLDVSVIERTLFGSELTRALNSSGDSAWHTTNHLVSILAALDPHATIDTLT